MSSTSSAPWPTSSTDFMILQHKGARGGGQWGLGSTEGSAVATSPIAVITQCVDCNRKCHHSTTFTHLSQNSGCLEFLCMTEPSHPIHTNIRTYVCAVCVLVHKHMFLELRTYASTFRGNILYTVHTVGASALPLHAHTQSAHIISCCQHNTDNAHQCRPAQGQRQKATPSAHQDSGEVPKSNYEASEMLQSLHGF